MTPPFSVGQRVRVIWDNAEGLLGLEGEVTALQGGRVIVQLDRDPAESFTVKMGISQPMRAGTARRALQYNQVEAV